MLESGQTDVFTHNVSKELFTVGDSKRITVEIIRKKTHFKEFGLFYLQFLLKLNKL